MFARNVQFQFITAAIVLTLTSPTSAQTLIRCPDWHSLVQQSAPIVLAKSTPKTSFDAALKHGATKKSVLSKPLDTRPKKVGTVHKTTTQVRNNGCPTYKVKAGDTLASIAQSQLGSAKKHGLILAANASTVRSAKSLRVGTVLTVPCEPPVLTAKAKSEAKPKAKPKGIFASFKPKPTVQPAPKAVAAVAPTPIKAKPLPVWRAKSGEYLSDVVKRWGKTAGYKVIVSGPSAWRLNVPVKEVGTFEETLSRLVKGFSADGQPPSVRVFSNKVIKIGSVL